MDAVTWIVTYRAVEDFLPLAREHRDAHVAALQDFRSRGLLLSAGPLQDPFNGDALSVFVSREAALEFVEHDPFVKAGVVRSWELREWLDFFA